MATPQGNDNFTNPLNRDMFANLLDNDDDFFHVTCHIELGLKENIECGEFVESERLLPKSRYNIQNRDRQNGVDH